MRASLPLSTGVGSMGRAINFVLFLERIPYIVKSNKLVSNHKPVPAQLDAEFGLRLPHLLTTVMQLTIRGLRDTHARINLPETRFLLATKRDPLALPPSLAGPIERKSGCENGVRKPLHFALFSTCLPCRRFRRRPMWCSRLSACCAPHRNRPAI